MVINKNKKKSAFTLIEVVVILLISSLGIMASLSLAIRSAYFQNIKKDLVTVIFLASEGAEIMANIRDTNIITERDYNDWEWLGSYNGVTDYTVDYSTLLGSAVSSVDETVLQQNVSGFYLHDTDYEDSIFSRMIVVQTEDDYTVVESKVDWQNRGNSYNYVVETILYDLSF